MCHGHVWDQVLSRWVRLTRLAYDYNRFDNQPSYLATACMHACVARVAEHTLDDGR